MFSSLKEQWTSSSPAPWRQRCLDAWSLVYCAVITYRILRNSNVVICLSNHVLLIAAITGNGHYFSAL